MPNNKQVIFVPVDPEVYGLGMALGCLMKFWPVLVVIGGIVIIIMLINNAVQAGRNFVDYGTVNNEQANAYELATKQVILNQENQKANQEIANATAIVQFAIATANASSGSLLSEGETWSKDGLSIQVKNVSFSPKDEGIIGFQLIIDDSTGENTRFMQSFPGIDYASTAFGGITFIDSSSPPIVVLDSSGQVFSSERQGIFRWQFANPTNECCVGMVHDAAPGSDREPWFERMLMGYRHLELEIRVTYGELSPNSNWISIQLPQFAPARNVEWQIPVR